MSQVFKDNLTMERECVLTAFSLTPTEGLLNQLNQLAEQSGFVNIGLAQVRNRKQHFWFGFQAVICIRGILPFECWGSGYGLFVDFWCEF